MDLHWSSDWDGHEVGFPDILVVSLYSAAENSNKFFYMDAETGDILEEWEIEAD